MSSNRRTVVTYLVLERKHGWRDRARIVRHSANAPSLSRGQCAVRVEIAVPEEAFEPVLKGPSVAFEIEVADHGCPSVAFEIDETLRAEVEGLMPEVADHG